MEYLKDFDVTINKSLSPVMKPTFVKAIIHLLLVLYAARIAPRLPRSVYDLFENQYFKLFIFSLILWTAQFSPSISILISLAFIMTINYANRQPIWEFMENESPIETPTPDKAVKDEGASTPVPTPDQAVEGIKILAEGASSSTPVPPEVVAPIANAVLSAATSTAGVDAITALAEQAMTPVAGVPEKVSEAVQVAVTSVAPVAQVPAPAPAPTAAPVQSKEAELQPAPCYPIRRQDMTKVGSYEVGSYQDWKA